jgi:hypothetical protein
VKFEDSTNARKGCAGCLVVIGALILFTIIGTVYYRSLPTSLNGASRYAERCHALLAADEAASSFLVNSAGQSPQALYDVANRMAKDAGEARSSIDAPNGFRRSGTAFENYADSLQQTYQKVADTVNEPTLRNTHLVTEAIAENNEYLKEAIAAFKKDVAESKFTAKERRRLLDRLLHGQ